MTSATPAPASTDKPLQPPQPDGLIGGAIEEGAGGIKKALAEGKGWGEADILAYAKTIGDNHPMFAESAEVGAGRMKGVRRRGAYGSPTHISHCL